MSVVGCIQIASQPAAYKIGLTPVRARAFEHLPKRIRKPQDRALLIIRLHFGDPNGTDIRCAKLTPAAALQLAQQITTLATDLLEEEHELNVRNARRRRSRQGHHPPNPLAEAG